MRLSVPLRVEDPEPAGFATRKAPDAGPDNGRRRWAGRRRGPATLAGRQATPSQAALWSATRAPQGAEAATMHPMALMPPPLWPCLWRRRPAPVDSEGQRPALPHPAAPRDLKRERLLRTHILLA